MINRRQSSPDLTASSQFLAGELKRRGWNSFDPEIRDSLYFIAGSLPEPSVSQQDVFSIVNSCDLPPSAWLVVENLVTGALFEAYLEQIH